MDDAFISEPATLVDGPLFESEPITAVIPHQTLAECAAAWRAAQAAAEVDRDDEAVTQRVGRVR